MNWDVVTGVYQIVVSENIVNGSLSTEINEIIRETCDRIFWRILMLPGELQIYFFLKKVKERPRNTMDWFNLLNSL